MNGMQYDPIRGQGQGHEPFFIYVLVFESCDFEVGSK